MSTRKFTVHINGHPGHHGNVLAFAFLERVRALLGALAHAERNYLGVPYRLTDYEIVSVAKINPTQMTLSPTTNQKNYDPVETLDWTLSQIERISKGEPADERVDEGLAKAFTRIVPQEHHIGATEVWISVDEISIRFDKNFKYRAEALAHFRKLTATTPKWAETRSHGSVVGELLQVDDWDGKAEFAIKPPIGPEQVQCKFPEALREKVKRYLFQTVRISGLLFYENASPFPARVEVDRIDPVDETPERERLSELRGLFEGRLRIEDEIGEGFDDL